jgi:hypothetical protein
MTKEQKIKIAQSCGLEYLGADDENEPELIGDIKAWSMFNDTLERNDEI